VERRSALNEPDELAMWMTHWVVAGGGGYVLSSKRNLFNNNAVFYYLNVVCQAVFTRATTPQHQV